MPQLKIIVMAHPAVWVDSVKDIPKVVEKVERLKTNQNEARSWLKIDNDPGTRNGIYKLESIEGPRFMAKIVCERDVKEDYQSVEEILSEEDCLPSDYRVPTPIPTASKATLFLDIEEGICYIYTDSIAPPLDQLANIIMDIGADCGFPCKDLRNFEWQENLVTTITRIAVDEGFDPYKVRADLEDLKVTAEGDFSDNDDWENIKNSIDLGKWDTIAFVKSKNGRPLVFGMSKKRKKQLSIPYLGDLSYDEMFQEILEMRTLIEKALGKNIRQECFPEKIKPITQFF